MLVIDADTSVRADSLNRLVSCAADDTRIIGICGETRLDNEQASWWTMIQGAFGSTMLSYFHADTQYSLRILYLVRILPAV
jgi:cellulose synthase/poly-beta-1,6-N-acetylglucosamine synthase-like glycosyltransferase